MDNTQPIEETTSTELEIAPTRKEKIVAFVKKPKNLIIAGAAAAAAVGGALVFAVLRSDESDFDAQQAEWDAEDAAEESDTAE